MRAERSVVLTPVELRIARLVAVGRRNDEVAGELALSSKTVEWRLTRIYRKLGVRSRTELAAQLEEEHGGEEELPEADA